MELSGTEITGVIAAAAAACAVAVKLVDRLLDLVMPSHGRAYDKQANDARFEILAALNDQTNTLNAIAREMVRNRSSLDRIHEALTLPASWRGPRVVSPPEGP